MMPRKVDPLTSGAMLRGCTWILSGSPIITFGFRNQPQVRFHSAEMWQRDAPLWYGRHVSTKAPGCSGTAPPSPDWPASSPPAMSNTHCTAVALRTFCFEICGWEARPAFLDKFPNIADDFSLGRAVQRQQLCIFNGCRWKLSQTSVRQKAAGGGGALQVCLFSAVAFSRRLLSFRPTTIL